MAGQSAGLVKSVRSCKDILDDIYLNSKRYRGVL